MSPVTGMPEVLNEAVSPLLTAISAFTPLPQKAVSCGSGPTAVVPEVPLELEELLVVAVGVAAAPPDVVGVAVPAAPPVVAGVAVPAAPLEADVAVGIGVEVAAEVAAGVDVAALLDEPLLDVPEEDPPVTGTVAAFPSGSIGVQADELLLLVVVVFICAKAPKLKTSAAIEATTRAAKMILIFTKTS